MEYYLKKGVMGFHISGFDVLFEDFGNLDEIYSELELTMDFLNEMHSWTKTFSKEDGLDR